MRTFEVQDGVKVTFYSPEEYKAILGSSVEGEFVAWTQRSKSEPRNARRLSHPRP
jgi:hypothetical protein